MGPKSTPLFVYTLVVGLNIGNHQFKNKILESDLLTFPVDF